MRLVKNKKKNGYLEYARRIIALNQSMRNME